MNDINNFGIIIQARLGSTRLPNKILKPFGNSTVLLFLIERLREKINIPIVVATTVSSKDDELCEYLKSNDIDFFRGSENNVLQRFIDTANEYNFKSIVRICSDSPLIDIELLKNLLVIWDCKLDYLSYSLDGKPTVLSHYGVFAELTNLNALNKLNNSFDNEYYKEHVTYGLYNNLEHFNVELVDLSDEYKKYSDIRLTLDTQDDYDNLNIIYNEVFEIKSLSFIDLANKILKDNLLIDNMKKNILNNLKK